ncbi:tRNA pseudouridine(54/55) synthase [Batrachochytrium salamandrivorans]|nr:tRNA pseudouridine(54/55) synthase [Batrachochytrium salamandrivorans]
MSALATLFKSVLPKPALIDLQNNVSNSDQIIGLLVDVGCCFRCVLRFLGNRHALTHESMPVHILPAVVQQCGPTAAGRTAIALEGVGAVFTTSTLVDAAENGLVENALGANDGLLADNPSGSTHIGIPKCVCPACLGLLQIDYASLARQAHHSFLQRPYVRDNNTFTVSNRMPPQLSIRQRSISLMIEEALEATGTLCTVSSDTNAVDKDTPTAPKAIPTAIDVKEILKYLVSNAFARSSGMTYDGESQLSLRLHLEHPSTSTDFMFLTEIPHAKFDIKKSRRKGVVIYTGASIDKISKAVSLSTYEDFKKHAQIPPPAVEQHPTISELDFEHSQIYIAGRYCKLQRGISNSPWVIGGKRLTEHSVEELIGSHIDKFFDAGCHKFSSAGREDADVLMLGTGRPFYFELINPRRSIASESELADLQRLINSSNIDMVSVCDLQIVTKDSTSIMKDSASSKSKSYSCVVEFVEPVSLETLEGIASQTDIAVSQRNPSRVPRRADLVRSKVIETIMFEPLQMQAFQEGDTKEGVKTVRVNLKTSAGTYVKEFVHGDEGRTEPCLASLTKSSSARVVELDVLEIHLDWPPTKPRE